MYIYIDIYIYTVFLYYFTFPRHAQTPVKTPKFPSSDSHLSDYSDDDENDKDLDEELSGEDTSTEGDLDDAKQQAKDPNAVHDCTPGK